MGVALGSFNPAVAGNSYVTLTPWDQLYEKCTISFYSQVDSDSVGYRIASTSNSSIVGWTPIDVYTFGGAGFEYSRWSTSGGNTNWLYGINILPTGTRTSGCWSVYVTDPDVSLQGGIKNYVNGVAYGMFGHPETRGTLVTDANVTEPYRMGRSSQQSNMIIGHLAVWNRALTDEEALDISNGASPLKYPTGLVHYFPFVEDYIDDVSGIAATGVETALVSSPAPTPLNPPDPDPELPPYSGTVGTRTAATNGTTKRFFNIGNSVSDTLDNAGLDDLATSQGYTHTWGRRMIPGAPLEWIVDNPVDGGFSDPAGGWIQNLSTLVWDDVSFQPFDRSVANDIAAIQDFLAVIKPVSPNFQPWIYQGWPLRPDSGTIDGTVWNNLWTDNNISSNLRCKAFYESVLTTLRTTDTSIAEPLMIPIGEVMYRLNQRMMLGLVPGYDHIYDLYVDGIHLDENAGWYMACCTAYSALYYRNPIGSAVPATFTGLSAEYVAAVQETVWEVVSGYQYTNGSYIGGGSTPDPTKPIAAFTYNRTGLSVTFSPTGSSAQSPRTILGYEWNFGDGSALNFSLSPTKVYSAAGTYTVTLRVMDDQNTYSDPVSQTFTVTAPSNPDPEPIPTSPLTLVERIELCRSLLRRIDRGNRAKLVIYDNSGIQITVVLQKPSFTIDQNQGRLMLNSDRTTTILNKAVTIGGNTRARLETSDGSIILQNLTVGTSGTHIIVSRTDLQSGDVFKLDSLTLYV